MAFHKIRFVSFWLTLGLTGVAHGWGDLGHETVATIAESNLTPDARAFVESILGPEPLSIAAIWPDQVREDRTNFLPFAAYHLCDAASDADVEATAAGAKKPLDCMAVLTQAPKLLLSSEVSLHAKIIMLRYLIHVAGDIHQPLHVGNGLDLGANLCDVAVETAAGIKKMNLHSTWDTFLVEGLKNDFMKKLKPKGYFGSSQLAQAILEDRALSAEAKAAFMKQEPAEWLRDAYQIRKKSAYPDALIDTVVTDERRRPYCKYMEFDGRINVVRDQYYDGGKIPLLTAADQQAASLIIKNQLLKGGLRLAGLLNRIAPAQGETKRPGPAKEVLQIMRNAGSSSAASP